MRRLTREREIRGWSRAELSRRAGLNPSQVGLFESGRLIPYPVQLRKLAGALEFGNDPTELMDEVQHEAVAA